MALTWNGGCGEGSGGILYPTTGQNADGAMTQKATSDTFSNYDNVVLKTLTVAGWQLNGTTYRQTLAFDEIYSSKPVITACGSTLGSAASDDQYMALGALKVVGDTDAKTMTFYAASAPTVDINLSIQGVA